MTDKKQPEALRLAARLEAQPVGAAPVAELVTTAHGFETTLSLLPGHFDLPYGTHLLYAAPQPSPAAQRDALVTAAPAGVDEPAGRTDAQMQKALMAYLQCTASELENYSLKLMDGYTADVQRILAAITPAPVGVEPFAWTDDGSTRSGATATSHRVVTNETKKSMPAAAAVSFTGPLYTADQVLAMGRVPVVCKKGADHG